MRPILLLPVLAALSACQSMDGSAPPLAPGTAAAVIVNGTVAYRQRIALPQDARVKVMLSDVSRADAAAPVIADIEMATHGQQVPIPFVLSYDPARIEPGHSYAISARITDGSGKLIWITDTRVPLPETGAAVDLMLVQVPG